MPDSGSIGGHLTGASAEGHARSATGSLALLLQQVARAAAPLSHPLERRLRPGVVLFGGRFEIVRRIGAGGMGIVYEAEDSRRKSRVALKTLSRLQPTGISQLKGEFRSVADVTHPNLVRLQELFADEGLWFFTMDLVDGVPFDRWVRP